jgi:hypothetical protein
LLRLQSIARKPARRALLGLSREFDQIRGCPYAARDAALHFVTSSGICSTGTGALKR